MNHFPLDIRANLYVYRTSGARGMGNHTVLNSIWPSNLFFLHPSLPNNCRILNRIQRSDIQKSYLVAQQLNTYFCVCVSVSVCTRFLIWNIFLPLNIKNISGNEETYNIQTHRNIKSKTCPTPRKVSWQLTKITGSQGPSLATLWYFHILSWAFAALYYKKQRRLLKERFQIEKKTKTCSTPTKVSKLLKKMTGS